jgi:hypothetical protein
MRRIRAILLERIYDVRFSVPRNGVAYGYINMGKAQTCAGMSNAKLWYQIFLYFVLAEGPTFSVILYTCGNGVFAHSKDVSSCSKQ